MRDDHRSLSPIRVRIRALLVISVAVVGVSGAFSISGARADSPHALVSTNGYCGGTTVPTDYSGALSLEGGPAARSAVDDLALAYSFWVDSTVYVYWNNSTTENCALETGTTTTGATGNFSFSVAPPASECGVNPNPPGGLECVNYSGPFGPVSVAPEPAPPAGYGLSTQANGSTIDLTWVADLSAVSLDPEEDPIVVSPNAPSSIVAQPAMANGTPSSILPTFDWGLNGSGWAFVGAPNGSGSVTVIAAPGAATGELSVVANATIGENAFRTPAAEVPLVATPTNLTSGKLDATVIDVGRAVGIAVVAAGAPGYAYTARVSPGLDQAPFDVPCASTAASPTSVSVRCTPSVTYSSPGTTTLSVEVSNGFSGANWTSPVLAIDPAPALTVNPDAPVGYAGTPIPVTLAMAPGSGTPPYRSACLVASSVPAECRATPGPNWTFDPTFASAGNYSATASVLDSSGANTTTTLIVDVADPLAVGAVAPAVVNVTVGSNVTLPSSVSGGVLPAEVWWNVSGDTYPLAEYSVDTDGPLSAVFSPGVVGRADIAITVRDALGTRALANRTVPVVTGPATAILDPEGESPIAGSTVSLNWEALDADRGPVPDFAEEGTLSLDGAGGNGAALAWANVSGIGALSVGPQSSFVVPASAWADGWFSVRLTPLTAGAITVNLGGGGVLGRGSGVPLDVLPDESHLHLFDPTVVREGWSSNATFWHVSDPFGNPVPGAEIVIQYSYGGASVDRPVAVRSTPGGGTGVWVNFTLPGPGATVRVLDLAGDLLLGPIFEPTPSGPPMAFAAAVLGGASGIGAVGALLPGVPRRWARRPPVADEETAARELAEGRATIVELVRPNGPVSRDGIADRWDPPPAPRDLDEWLASLVADGTLLSHRLPDGEATYVLAPAPAEAERIVIDPEAIDRALARRDAAVREGPDEPKTG